MKHTPGPWEAHFEEAYFVTGPDLGRVAMMMNLKGAHGMGGRRSGDESAANARLISAAPDMAEALRDLLGRLGKYIDRRVPDDGPDWEFSKLWKEIEKARAALAKAGL